MASRRARERANARPWEAGEQPEPDDHQHAGDFPDRDDDEQPERQYIQALMTDWNETMGGQRKKATP